ncbi:hypothetical protein [Maricaulis sp.]
MAGAAGMYRMLGVAVLALPGTARCEVLMADMVVVSRHSRFCRLSSEG